MKTKIYIIALCFMCMDFLTGCKTGPDRYYGNYRVDRLENPPELCIAIADRIAQDLGYTQKIDRIGSELINVDMFPIRQNTVYLICVGSQGYGTVAITILQVDPNETPDTERTRQAIDKILNEIAPGHWIFEVFHNSMAW